MHQCNHKFTLEACGLELLQFCHNTDSLHVFVSFLWLNISRFGMGEGLQGLMNQVSSRDPTNHDRRLRL